jgi:hypothetical protein
MDGRGLIKNVPFFRGLHHKLDLCYTLHMNFDHQIWDRWVESLQRWGLGDFVASLLEAAGPLTIVGAQVVYILQPFWGPRQSLQSLADMLENPDQVRSFVQYLREGTTT